MLRQRGFGRGGYGMRMRMRIEKGVMRGGGEIIEEDKKADEDRFGEWGARGGW